MTNSFTDKWNEVRHALRHHWSDLRDSDMPESLEQLDKIRLKNLIEDLRTLYGKFEAERILLERE